MHTKSLMLKIPLNTRKRAWTVDTCAGAGGNGISARAHRGLCSCGTTSSTTAQAYLDKDCVKTQELRHALAKVRWCGVFHVKVHVRNAPKGSAPRTHIPSTRHAFRSTRRHYPAIDKRALLSRKH